MLLLDPGTMISAFFHWKLRSCSFDNGTISISSGSGMSAPKLPPGGQKAESKAAETRSLRTGTQNSRICWYVIWTFIGWQWLTLYLRIRILYVYIYIYICVCVYVYIILDKSHSSYAMICSMYVNVTCLLVSRIPILFGRNAHFKYTVANTISFGDLLNLWGPNLCMGWCARTHRCSCLCSCIQPLVCVLAQYSLLAG